MDAVVTAGATAVERRVTGPDGRPVDARFAVRGRRAVVELAEASGLALLGDRRSRSSRARSAPGS